MVKLSVTFFKDVFYARKKDLDYPISVEFIENLKDVIEVREPRHDAAGVCKDEIDGQRDGAGYGAGDEKKIPRIGAWS